MEIKSLISFVFLLQAIINDSNHVKAQKPGQQAFKCGKTRGLTTHVVQQYRDTAFEYLVENIAFGRYDGYGIGDNNEYSDNYQIYSMALCPPNIKAGDCQECVKKTIPYLKTNCPNQNKGVAWTASANLNCMVRYGNYQIQGQLDEWVTAIFSSPPNQAPGNAVELEKALNNLANKLKGMAAVDDKFRKFGFGSVTYGPRGSHTLYGSMQCTPDIGKDDCAKCLTDATNEIHNCCSKARKLSGRVMSANCYFRYAHQSFLPKKL